MEWAIRAGGPQTFLTGRRLESLLPLICPTGVKDPRDKVLALLGIAHDDQKRIRFPDYCWPASNLYIAIAKYCLESEDDPDPSFLSHVQESNPAH